MTGQLQAGRAGAEPGSAAALIIFVHGYGANGADLLSLAPMLEPELPGWGFLAPDAPDPCPGAPPGGRQWAPIPAMDGSDAAVAQAAFLRSADMLDRFIDGVLAEYGLPPEKLFVFGFSQGAMLALHVAPRRAAPIGGVIAASGMLIAPERLAAEVRVKPPVLLVHGDQDAVVSPAALPQAAEALQGAGFPVYAHVSKGTGHGIAPDGLGAALAFLRQFAGPADTPRDG
jgi:phospholipase/carboxylesterase